MTQDIATIQPSPLALIAPQTEIDDFKEALVQAMEAGGLSEFDLPKITIAPGALKVPSASGTQLVERIEGVVVGARTVRVFYRSKDAGSRPPDCSSRDSLIGIGDPGGNCIPRNGKPGCPYAEFESATTADGKPGKGQACKQVQQLFMLRGESFLPEIVNLPPTSLKAARQFFVKQLGRRLSPIKLLIAVRVQNAKNAYGQEYGTAVLDVVRPLSEEEIHRAMEFRDFCAGFIQGRTIDLPPEMYSAVQE